MSRNAMKISLSISMIGVLLVGYTNCSNPKVDDAGSNPYSSMSDPNNGLKVAPAGQTLGLGQSVKLSVSGGTGPYRFFLSSGAGSVDANSGIYTASNVESDAVIMIEDIATGKVGQAVIKVALNASSSMTLSFTPGGSVKLNSELTLLASGGTAPYTYFMYAGVGAVSGNEYYATATGTGVVAVRDSKAQVSTFSINVGGPDIGLVPIYRLYHSGAKQYLFSKTKTEGTNSGYVLQGSTHVFKLLATQPLGSAQVIRCYVASNGGRYLTSLGSCAPNKEEGPLGYVYTYKEPNTIPLYNCFKPSTGTYFVSTDTPTCTDNGYNVEAKPIGWIPQ